MKFSDNIFHCLSTFKDDQVCILMFVVLKWTYTPSIFLSSLGLDSKTLAFGPQMSEIVWLNQAAISPFLLLQDCVVIENNQTVTLNAPKGSATMKSSEKGIGMSLHKFSFSQVRNRLKRRCCLSSCMNLSDVIVSKTFPISKGADSFFWLLDFWTWDDTVRAIWTYCKKPNVWFLGWEEHADIQLWSYQCWQNLHNPR